MSALAGSAFASSPTRLVLFDDLPTGPQAMSEEQQRYLVFGEAIFDYYSDRQFSTLSGLRVNQTRGLFNGDTGYAELLMGELYVSYGLPAEAEQIFDRLLARDMLAQTRAETWLHKASLHYRQGEHGTARRVLEGKSVQALPEALAVRGQLMLANILIAQGDFAGATRQLEQVALTSVSGAYARYNVAVARLRSGDLRNGLRALDDVIQLPPDSEEIRALRDRAALTKGLSQLRAGNFSGARDALIQVRADGPFSNEALMVLGLVNFERGAPRAALPLWMELMTRHPAHESVQEAMLLAPRAFEELGAEPQALAGYQQAARNYRAALHEVERAIRNVDNAEWLPQLADNGGQRRDVDPMARLARFDAAQGEEMPYLYALFASHGFSERHHQYQQITRLRELLQRRQRELPALQDTLAQRQRQHARVLPSARARLEAMQQQQTRLSEEAEMLNSAMSAQLDIRYAHDMADLPQSIMWQRLQALNSQPGLSPQQRRRLARLRGLLLWDIAHGAEQRRIELEKTARALRDEARIQALRAAALEQLLNDAEAAGKTQLATRLQAREADIANLINDADDALAELGQQLKNEALRVLAERRARLGEQLGEAHLAIARLQDAAYSGTRPGTTTRGDQR
ncbi:tetratricopeptide repeat protein [Alcanivorax sp. JB21]|nr:tetratricopeptide repeat protein [Alcanivorax limicola]